MRNKNCLLAGIGFVLLVASASASATLIANGNFQTGALAPEWTTFTTANGTLGTPTVTSFDVTGGGASNAAQFQAGQVVFTSGVQEGGGIFQNFASGAGMLSATLDIATQNLSNISNGEGGIFSVLLDNVVLDIHNFGVIGGNTTLRSSLAFNTPVAAGTHELKILITRPFILGTGNEAPFQYIDNVVVNGSAPSVPEPGMLALFAMGAGAFRLASRRTQ